VYHTDIGWARLNARQTDVGLAEGGQVDAMRTYSS